MHLGSLASAQSYLYVARLDFCLHCGADEAGNYRPTSAFYFLAYSVDSEKFYLRCVDALNLSG